MGPESGRLSAFCRFVVFTTWCDMPLFLSVCVRVGGECLCSYCVFCLLRFSYG